MRKGGSERGLVKAKWLERRGCKEEESAAPGERYWRECGKTEGKCRRRWISRREERRTGKIVLSPG